ncbi:hypothetical protein MZM54_03965 [[Brevibacterium] frigoritolerans]|nr:hypothetical protein [Peribacillus frigoritolerans]
MLIQLGKICAIMFTFILAIAGCSNNKLDLEKSLFEDGQKLAAFYYSGIEGSQEEADEEVRDIEMKMEETFNEMEEDSDKDEDLLVSSLMLIKTNYELYNIQSANENLSGENSGESQGTKQAIESQLMDLEEKFGIEYK